MIQIPPINNGYRAQATDTSVKTDAFEFFLLRQRTNAQRLEMSANLTRWARSMSARAMRKVNEATFRERFAQSVLGDHWLPCLTPTSDPDMWIQDPSEIARLLHPILERLDIPYYITGGVAASMYGDPRTTRDMDLVIEMALENLPQLVTALEQAGFYCPPGAIEELQQERGRTLSVTHMEQVLSADIVLSSDSDFDHSKMQRRRLESIDVAGTLQVWVCSPEDLVLAKLLWGQRSQSEKQWRDVLGILKVQVEALDYGYLAEWGEQLGIGGGLRRALREAGV